MLLWFLVYESVVVLTSSATAVSYDVTAPSSCPTVTGCYCSGLSAYCHGNDTIYAQAVQALPSDLETFVFSMSTTDSYMTLDLRMGGGLKRFWNLQLLKVQPYSKEIKYKYGIEEPTASAFCNLTNLRELHLNVNNWFLKPEAVQCLQTLDTLDLSNMRALRTVDLKAVLAAPLSRHITTLLLRKVQQFNNQEAYMPEVDFGMLFRGLNLGNLRVLDLSNNAFTGLKPGLAWMFRLEKLDLSYNLLVVQAAWSYLSRLTMFEAFRHANLREVIAVNQGFFPRKEPSTESIKEKDKKLNQQKKAQLRNEGIGSLSKSWRTAPLPVPGSVSKSGQPEAPQARTARDTNCMFNIKDIPIGNQLSIINIRGFLREADPYTTVVPHGTLCLNPDNNLQEIDVSDMQIALFVNDPTLTNVSVTGLGRLKILNARNNGLTAHYRMFLNPTLPSLQILMLGGNKIKLGPFHLESNKQAKPPLSLQHLDLSENGLSVVPREEFLHLSNLHILDVSRNQLEDVNFQLPESLQLLDISGNKLTFLSEVTTKYLDTFHNLTVDMTHNYFVCGCKVYHFIHWIQHTKTNLTNQHDLYCFTERGRMRITEINLRKLHKECNPMTPFELGAIGASASLALVLTVLLCFVTYRKRWRILRFLYRVLYGGRRRREWDQLNDDCEYDAFIAYSDETPEVRRWVNVTMQTELERNRGVELFIHQRDLLGGGFLLERIDDAMRRCRKTVLVLSPEFLRSRVCLYQAWSAHTSMVTEQRDAVVLVRLQALPVAGITATLTSLMEIRECLNWTDDPEGQELFWERLTDVLLSPPDNPINN